MSDVETPPENKGKKDRNNGAEAHGEPVVVDQSLFDFLEELFYGTPASYPERLEIRIVYGAKSDKYGPPLKTIRFAPATASEEVLKRSPGRGKPNKIELVRHSNLILTKIKEECDQSRKSALYGVLAWNSTSSDEPYDRWTKRFDPKGRYALKDGETVEEEDEQSKGDRVISQMLKHSEEMHRIHSESMMGIMERFDRMNGYLLKRNENLEGRFERFMDMAERLMTAEQKRKSEAAWDEIRQDAAKRGLKIVETVGTPLLASVFTKPGSQAEADIEVKTLQDFFKAIESGEIPEAVAYEAFGHFDAAGKPTKPGILTDAQSTILVHVARKLVPTSDLDHLVPPAGKHAITQEQFMALVQVMGIERLLPLKLIFDNHSKK